MQLTNSRDTGRDHFFGINTGIWVDGRSVDVKIFLCKDLWSIVDRATRTIKYTTQHILRNSDLQVLTSKLDVGFPYIDSGCALEYLYRE